MGTASKQSAPSGASVDSMPNGPRPYSHIWMISGPAGCGKSTAASHVAEQLSLPYIEGDEFHPQANIDKMSSGTPLSDEDRWEWLIILRQQALDEISRGASGVVITCSALKRKYRDVIRVASKEDNSVLVHFVYLQATEDILLARVKARKDHYMKDDMVKSQFRSLEEPSPDETDILVVDASGTLAEMQEHALSVVRQTIQHTAGQSNNDIP